ncbi:MAG: hypothetical protein R3261_07570, partial [Alphaproteobacteria bacterium]|nr:hypothetical protein [Alphaproteobacteria bacterium]
MAKKKNKNSNSNDKQSAIIRQYEDLPYPERLPEDENKRLIEGSPGHLIEMRHYLFNGKLP